MVAFLIYWLINYFLLTSFCKVKCLLQKSLPSLISACVCVCCCAVIASQGKLMSVELPEDRFSLSIDFVHCWSERTSPDTVYDLFSGWESSLQQVDLFQTVKSFSTVGIFHCLDVCERYLQCLISSPWVGRKSISSFSSNPILHGVTVKFAACRQG